MLSDVLRAYTENNIDLAISIPARDKKLDAMNHEITENLTVQMTKFPERITEYLDLIFIARHLERAGDHVKNIAEDVVFAIAAEDIRHMGAQRPGSAADLLGEKSPESVAARARPTKRWLHKVRLAGPGQRPISANLILTRTPKLIGAIWRNLLAASAIRQASPYLKIRLSLPHVISAQHLASSHPLQHRNSG